MSDIVARHRDAARVLRAEAKKYEQRLDKTKAKFYRDQATWYDLQADRLVEEYQTEEKLHDMILLYAREAMFQDREVGYLRSTTNEHASLLIINHHILGNQWFRFPSSRIPSWIHVWTGPMFDTLDEDPFEEISAYVRQP